MVRLKIDCDDCVTWYVSEGIWTYDANGASIISLQEARQIVADMPNAIARQHSVFVFV